MPEKTNGPKRIDRGNIDQTERETLDLVIKMLPELEKVLASWDGLKHKPKDMKGKFEKYRLIHSALSDWARKVLVSPDEDYLNRADRLWEFVFICRSLKEAE